MGAGTAGRAQGRRWAGATPVLFFGLAAALMPGAASAEDLPEGGQKLSFGISFGLDTNDNLDLDPVSPGSTTQFTTGLSFGALSQTEYSLFQLDVGLDLQWNQGPDYTQPGLDASLPDIALTWQRNGPNSTFNLNATYVVSDLNDLRPVDDFDTGTGMRRDTDLAFDYTWGTAGPFQIGVQAEGSTSDYFDNPSPELVDSQDVSLGLNLGFDLSPVATLALGVTDSRLRGNPGILRPGGNAQLHRRSHHRPAARPGDRRSFLR